MKSNATLSDMKMVKLSEPITSLFPQRGSGNFPVTGSKPSSIRLVHLNSIAMAMPPGHASTIDVGLSDGLQGMKSTSSMSLHKVENMKRSLISSNMDGQSLVDTRHESHETDASVAADSFISESPSLTEPNALNQARAHDKRRLSSTDARDTEELNQLSPGKKKSVLVNVIFLIVHNFYSLFFIRLIVSPNIALLYRKRTSITADDNGNKPCNCKKSKCLKL